jgi:cytochrome c oxidase assembly protein subunit 15
VIRGLTTHLVVALVALVVIGGATRVMEAGLACPDWPLCYGVFLPGRQMNPRVFLEWFHRLDAFLVGIALLVLLTLSVWWRRQLPAWYPWASTFALALVAVQGALGALTVSGLLASSTVTAHLATALLLVVWISALDQFLPEGSLPKAPPAWWFPLPVISLVLVFSQCVLGGAMASQWAVDHCFQSGDLCEWLLLHRQLALPATLSVAVMAAASILSPSIETRIKTQALVAISLVGLQVSLGLLTLRAQLQAPLLTIGHQLVAALLVAQLSALCGRMFVLWFNKSESPSLKVSCG